MDQYEIKINENKRSVLVVFDLEQGRCPIPIFHIVIRTSLIIFHIDFMFPFLHKDLVRNIMGPPVEITCHESKEGVFNSIDNYSALEPVVTVCPKR